MARKGFSAAQVLAMTGISQDQLASPALLVERGQWQTVVDNMFGLTKNPGLGFEIGHSLKLVDFGIVAHAMMSSRTLGQAIGIWARFSDLVGMTIRLSVEDGRDIWSLHYDTLGLHGRYQWFAIEEILAGGIRLGEALTDRPFELAECNFKYPAPQHASLYETYLACPLNFGAKETSFRLRSPRLDVALRGSDPEFNEICLEHCGHILRQIGRRSPTVAALRTIFVGRPRSLPSLEEAADCVGMSSRSLRRYLLTKETSYQKLVDEFRFDMAKTYLKVDHLTPKDVAYLLGFGSASAFRRAFKLWAGCTVSEYTNSLFPKDADSG